MNLLMALASLTLLMPAQPTVETTVGDGEISHLATFPSFPVAWTRSVQIPGFDPTYGELVSVTVSFAATMEAIGNYENLCPSPITNPGSIGIDVGVSWFESQIELKGLFSLVEEVLDSFDGTIDFGGLSGISVTVTEEDSEDYAPKDLEGYITAKPIDFTVMTNRNSFCFLRIGVCQVFVDSSVELEITYIFTPHTGDFDSDGDVDFLDFGSFQLCYSGSNMLLDSGCERGDFDQDGDIDLIDFAEFQLAFTGS